MAYKDKAVVVSHKNRLELYRGKGHFVSVIGEVCRRAARYSDGLGREPSCMYLPLW